MHSAGMEAVYLVNISENEVYSSVLSICTLIYCLLVYVYADIVFY